MTDLFTDPRLPSALDRLAAPGGYEAFESQVKGARFCRRPVRLKGSVTQTQADGSTKVLFDSASQPDRVLLKACGTRRQTLCPPCASIYRGDAFALVAAGLRGGKGIPEEVSNHPAVLLTLTAPSFGVVHRMARDGTCHRSGPRCPHGVAVRCGRRHPENDPQLGQALCSACYDYDGAVLFNASVSELWRRTTIYALRALGNLAGISVRSVVKEVRLSYVKVVEFQRRGSVHLHALVRLDAVGDDLSAPPDRFSAELLSAALELAARRVWAPPAGIPDSTDRVRWGREIDVAIVTDRDAGRRRAAAYLAKYSTKSTEDHGLLDHRLPAGVPDALELSAHLRNLVESAWRLGGGPGGEELHLRAWAHTAGYRGHCLTKSRRFSTTFAALRALRQEWTVAGKLAAAREINVLIDNDSNDVDRDWTFMGMGYTTPGDAWLAESIAEEERLARRSAYEERQVGEGA